MNEAPPPDRYWDKLLNLLAGAAALILLAMLLVVSLSVVSRYFLGRPIGWIAEASGYGLLFATFLGAPWILRERGHVTVDLVVDMLGRRAALILGIVTGVVGLAVFAMIGIFSGRVAWNAYVQGHLTATLLRVPRYLIVSVITVGSVAMAGEFLRQVLDDARRLRQGE